MCQSKDWHNHFKYKKWTLYLWTQKSKTFKSYVLILNLTDKIVLRRREKVLLYQILVLITHGKYKTSYNNKNKFKISAPT